MSEGKTDYRSYNVNLFHGCSTTLNVTVNAWGVCVDINQEINCTSVQIAEVKE